MIRTARGLILSSFGCGVKIVITVEVLQYAKYTCTRSHISGSLEKKAGKECSMQPELVKGVIAHWEITIYNFDTLKLFGNLIKSQTCCV